MRIKLSIRGHGTIGRGIWIALAWHRSAVPLGAGGRPNADAAGHEHVAKLFGVSGRVRNDPRIDDHASVAGHVPADALGGEVGSEDGDQRTSYVVAESGANGSGAPVRHPVS